MFDFAAHSLSSITSAYNAAIQAAVAASGDSEATAPFKPVKAFRTKPLAVERIEKLCAEFDLDGLDRDGVLVLVSAQTVPVVDPTIDPREDAEEALDYQPTDNNSLVDALTEGDVEKLEEVLVDSEGNVIGALDQSQADFARTVGEAPAPAKAKREKKVKAPKEPSDFQRAEYREDQVITVVGAVKAREGTNRAARYGTLRTGMTVGDYLDAAYAANNGARSRHRYHSDVRLLVAKGVVTVK